MKPVAWRRKLKHGWEYRDSEPTAQTRSTGWMPLYQENSAELFWNHPESIPVVAEGKESPYWIAVANEIGKVFVFMAYYQNCPIDENGEDTFDSIEDINGDPIGSVGWVDAKQHPDYDSFWYAITFNDNYKLLGWAEYTAPEFTGVSA